jgi:hypothetical protein
MHQKHCESKTKITDQESGSNPHKNISLSLSQPALSANPTSSRNILRNWQPPLKKFCYDRVIENKAQNLCLQEITPCTDKMCDDSTGNDQTAMDCMDGDDGKVHTESKTVGYNENVEEDESLSQQCTQKFVCTEHERYEMQGEKNKYEENEKDEVRDKEIICAVQAAGKEPECNYVHVTNSSDVTAGNIDPDPSSTTCNDDENTSLTKHFEQKTDRCLISTKYTQNENNQVSTKDEDKEQDMLVSVQEGSGKNIMNKFDSIILPPDKKFLPLTYKASNCEEESKIKPGYDSITCHNQSLRAQLPQYMHSMKTLIGSEGDSPLPSDLVLKDLIHLQLTDNTTEEMELTKEQPVTPETIAIKISEQKSGTNKCDDTPNADDERGKNNYSPLVPIEAKKISCRSGNETEHQESSFLTNDLPINKSEVHSVKLTETVTLSASGGAEVPEICNASNTGLHTHKECEDMEMSTPKVLFYTDLNNQPESSKLGMEICDVKDARLKTNTGTENVRTASHLMDAVTAEDYSENPSEPLTATNISTEEHFTEKHEEASNTGPCSTVSTKNGMSEPGTDLNTIYENCFKHPATNGEGGPQVGNEEPPTVHPSTLMTKALPKPEEMNQSEGYLYRTKEVFCKSPTIAMEAPNLFENAAMTNENTFSTAGHDYLLDDDIGLTGSQLLRIEDECQYKVQSTEGARNYASFCGEATVPDTAVFAPKLPPANWAQIMQEKRQKLRNIIQDISRLK